MHTLLSLIVLRSARTNAMLEFYAALGLTFVQEQHGTGPVHHSCIVGDSVLEIYPGSEGGAPNYREGGATMLGFRVSSVDAVLDALQKSGALVLTQPKDSPWGRRAVVADPDGRAVEILERANSAV